MTQSTDGLLSSVQLESTNQQPFSQQTLLGHYSVLYFYPKDSTPGCTTEGLDFQRLLPEFEQLNAKIYGISMDSMKRHENFKSKQGFEFDLISDPQAELCSSFGIYQLKKNFGKEYMGIVRSTFLLDPQGETLHAWRKVKVKGHAEEVLETLKEIIAA
ncbi:peroxiredoxin [Thiomicrorhabdus heinhorstiae]|uniref:thioredoxin-dependent peroxiredoxin n=1 Tax=Thiomicrorhabdus heinhorstiae TaxID=2748010 RepID=A0ABS0BWV0_9GAMM|nr:peroxiredoxin [Thiomicrorhabdus heinhorstiae]MBF6058287.1 peroxiredoxin [Thiomicrorhabdus heinhorstiae]